MASSRRWLALTAFVALIAGAGGVSAGILIASPPTPASLSSPSVPSTVPVTTREFTDTRSLTLTIPPASPHELHLPHSPGASRPSRQHRKLPSRQVLSPARLMAFPFLPWPCPLLSIRTWWMERPDQTLRP